MSDFLTDIKTLRKRAREHTDQGPITDAYTADKEHADDLVNLLRKLGS
jgi:bacterioferritin